MLASAGKPYTSPEGGDAFPGGLGEGAMFGGMNQLLTAAINRRQHPMRVREHRVLRESGLQSGDGFVFPAQPTQGQSAQVMRFRVMKDQADGRHGFLQGFFGTFARQMAAAQAQTRQRVDGVDSQNIVQALFRFAPVLQSHQRLGHFLVQAGAVVNLNLRGLVEFFQSLLVFALGDQQITVQISRSGLISAGTAL